MSHWDNLAKEYNDIFLKDPLYLKILEKMVMEVDGGDRLKVLDIGCGTGNLILRLLEDYPAIDVVGMDPSIKMREVCAERFRGFPNVEIKEGDALDMPVPDGSFDYALSSLALHHIPPEQKEKCAMEIARALKVGGFFIHTDAFCSVPGSQEDPDWCRDVIEKMVSKALYSLDQGAFEMMLGELSAIPAFIKMDGEYLTTVEEWVGILEGAGFIGFNVIDMPPIDVIKIITCQKGTRGRGEREEAR